MSSLAPIRSIYPTLSTCVADLFPTTRGPMLPIHGYVLAKQRLSTDSLGNCNIVLTNTVVGSRYRIELADDGTTVADGVVSTSDVTVSVPYYASGNSNNNLRIKVRKASSEPKYQPFESFITANALGGSVYVAQVLDTIA